MQIPVDIFTPIEQKHLYNQIVDQIINLIEQGEFKPGIRLPSERDLARFLKVSRVSLREALTVLKIMGVVETVSGQGTYIKSASVILTGNLDAGESPHIILQARKVIEPSIVGFAAIVCNEASLNSMEGIIEKAEQDYSQNKFGSEFFNECDRQFHLDIARSTQNPILINFQEVIYSFMSQKLWLSMISQTTLTTQGRWKQAIVEHRGIYEAIKSRNSKIATSHVVQHLTHVEDAMNSADLL